MTGRRTERQRRSTLRSLIGSQRFRAAAFVGCAVVVLWAKPMGLLLWARLRILANIPRTAIADDESTGAGSFEPRDWATFPPVEPVVLPGAVSRNPFVKATTSAAAETAAPARSEQPAQPDTNWDVDSRRQ